MATMDRMNAIILASNNADSFITKYDISPSDSDNEPDWELFHDEKEASYGTPFSTTIKRTEGLNFVFGTRTFTMKNDGTTIATNVWTSSLVGAALVHQEAILGIGNLSVTDRDVLEIGCGCGLVGLTAALHSCKSLTLCDCDDRVLVDLYDKYNANSTWWNEDKQPREKSYRQSCTAEKDSNLFMSMVSSLLVCCEMKKDEHKATCSKMGKLPVCNDIKFNHHLWEEDLKIVENREASLTENSTSKTPNGSSNAEPESPRIINLNRDELCSPLVSDEYVPSEDHVPHWCDHCRKPEHPACQKMKPEEDFDVVIASDCLYFTSQELSLVGVLKLRLRRSPASFALIVVQVRSNGVYQKVRQVEYLQQAGFIVEDRELDSIDTEKHLVGNSQVKLEGKSTLSNTGMEVQKFVLVVRWKM